MLYNIFNEFEWDDVKASANFLKHGIRFSEAVSVWLDDNALEMTDPDHSHIEERWIRIGFSKQARILVIVYSEKLGGARIRIISARKATLQERMYYSERSTNER